MSTTREGPAVDSNAGFWHQAQDFLFDVGRAKLIDQERVGDDGNIRQPVDVQSQSGNPATATPGSSGWTPKNTAMLLGGAALVVGFGWLATQ